MTSNGKQEIINKGKFHSMTCCKGSDVPLLLEPWR